MAIRDDIQLQMTQALKSGDKKRLDALRYLFSQLKNREIDAKGPLIDEETMKFLQSEAKRRKEAADAFQKGGRQDLAEKERYELSVIEGYLPEQMSDEEIKSIISAVKAANPDADFGTLMRETMTKIAGRADGGRVAKLLRNG